MRLLPVRARLRLNSSSVLISGVNVILVTANWLMRRFRRAHQALPGGSSRCNCLDPKLPAKSRRSERGLLGGCAQLSPVRQ